MMKVSLHVEMNAVSKEEAIGWVSARLVTCEMLPCVCTHGNSGPPWSNCPACKGSGRVVDSERAVKVGAASVLRGGS